jgi:hypothetical protein
MNQKKTKMLKKLAKSYGIPFGVMKKRYAVLNKDQRGQLAKELVRINRNSL